MDSTPGSPLIRGAALLIDNGINSFGHALFGILAYALITLNTPAGAEVLKMSHSAALPLKEVSGLCAHQGSVYAVGDRTHQIFEIPLSPRGEVLKNQVRSQELLQKIPGAQGVRSSQWEAIQMDQSGMAVVLSESPPQVVILKPKTFEFIKNISLRVPAVHPLHSSWTSDHSSGGEGLLLLEDGLLLIAKEKNPTALLLFGPLKSKPSEEIQLLKSKNWKVPEISELGLLWSWTPTDNAMTQLKDFSELAVSPQGDILILSDQSRQFCSVLKKLSLSEARFDTNTCFSFKEKFRNPEGLVHQGFHVVVGVDNTAKIENIFFFPSNLVQADKIPQ